jgi:hypothetical protein
MTNLAHIPLASTELEISLIEILIEKDVITRADVTKAVQRSMPAATGCWLAGRKRAHHVALAVHNGP